MEAQTRKDPWTMLGQDVVKQRIDAARTLRGVSQTTLNQLFEEDGLGKRTAGRIERGELTMQRAHRDAFCRHLRVPARWFNSADVDEVVGYAELPEYLSRDDLSAAAALLAPELLGGVQALLKEQEQGGQGKDKPGRPPGDPGGGS